MKKRFKMISKNDKVYLMKWVADGKLFGPDWEQITSFGEQHRERCKQIIKLLNECDNDRTGNTPNRADVQ